MKTPSLKSAAFVLSACWLMLAGDMLPASAEANSTAASYAHTATNAIEHASNTTAHAPKKPLVLEGEAEMAVDPDVGDKQVLIEWDKWRNKVVHAAWVKWGKLLEAGSVSLGTLKMCFGMPHPHAFANGLSATFRFSVTRDRQIRNLRISEPSGDPEFDALVLRSVKSLDGKPILAFPKLSHRGVVAQACTFRLGKTEFRQKQFNDVEQYTASD